MPHSYLYYPETANRSLEEIDFFFAKGYFEKISYVKAAREMPRLSVEDMETLAQEWGLADAATIKQSVIEREVVDSEKEQEV